MATSSCSKCGEHSFEQVEVTPERAQFPVRFIQCVTCGTVIGVTDSSNVLSKMHRIEELLKKVVKKQEFV
jgi:hypothetical protein